MSSPPPPSARTSPTDHATASFAPIEVQVDTPTVRGPFVDTSNFSPAESDSTSSSSPPPQVEVVLGDEELDKVAEWNKERIERRLRGEYERAGKQLNELVEDNLDTPLRLNAIRIIGAKHTRQSFLSSILAPFLPQLPSPAYFSSTTSPSSSPESVDSKAQTLGGLLRTTRDVSEALSRFDLFKEIEAGLETSPSVLSEREDVDIVLRVKEAPRYFFRTATDVGDGEGSATATARVRNAFGGAETVEGNLAFGTRTKSAFQLRLETPVNASPTDRAEFSIFSAQRDLNYYASCSESTRGAQARYKTVSAYGLHEIAYDAILRQIGDILPSASMTIRDAAGPSVKSSVSHTFIRDTRNDIFAPSSGSFLKLKQEYAGLGGDANFFKTESESSLSRALGSGCSVSFGVRTGFLLPIGARKTLFADKFHLGGPTSVRMFRPNAMGPKDNRDYIGGNLHWAAGVSLVTPFPRKPNWPLKNHFFINAGRLTNFDTSRALSSSLEELTKQASVTAGFGLMYRHSFVRIEANLGVPLAMGKQEGGVKGLQFGLGLSFL